MKSKNTKKARGGSETILVVEDEQSVRTILVHSLEEYGYRVLSAGDGEQAVKLFQKYSNEIKMVITDVVMPGMSGREVYERIIAEFPDVKFLFISGYSRDEIHQSFIRQRGVNFMSKPFIPAELELKVRQVLDQENTTDGKDEQP